MENKRNHQEDSQFEGKDKVYLDIDRIINEGLAGGTVEISNDTTNIEEARNLKQETPPKKS